MKTKINSKETNKVSKNKSEECVVITISEDNDRSVGEDIFSSVKMAQDFIEEELAGDLPDCNFEIHKLVPVFKANQTKLTWNKL